MGAQGGYVIAISQVIVGDLIGQDAADKESVVGETLNLAARFQTLEYASSISCESLISLRRCS